ncbi:hypothetical protein ACTI_23800 [Actinoplanes sp. OR16]|nr:hypothetical protein ACTI_23800 [Actinoplanes sp. OR16]
MATQAAAALALLSAARGGLTMILCATAAAALLVITWVRIRGLWAYQWLAAMTGFATRRRTTRFHDLAVAAQLDDPGPVTLLDLPALPPLRMLSDDQRLDLRLVLCGGPAPVDQAGAPAISYRSLGPDVPLAHFRAVLAIRSNGLSGDDRRRAVKSLVRKLKATETVRPEADLDPGDALHESWSSVTAGGLTLATFRCRPEPGAVVSARLLTRLLHLPAAATTVALTLSPVTVLVRIAAPEPAALETAARALGDLLASERFAAHRCDGEQLPALAATLPLANRPPQAPFAAGLALPVIDHGLLLGHNRQGRAVLIRPFRAAPSRMVLVGSARCAQLIAFRSLGIGARVVVRTNRPAAWATLRQAVDDESLALNPAGVPAGSQLRPTLLVGDDGTDIAEPAPWTTTLTVLDEADPDLAASADLLLLQTLGPDEAALLDPVLDLGDGTAAALTEMPPDLVAIITNKAVRWAAPAPTFVEKVLIGHPARHIALHQNKRQISI